MSHAWSIGRAVNELTAAFEAAGLDTPRLDARILVGHAVKLEASLLFARGERILSGAEAALVRDFAARRVRHEPVSRITGQRGFWGLDFAITPDTLDPRPDTEALVSAVLATKAQYIAPRILDLGTGSGCILLAILKDWPEATGLGVDINSGAVTAAAANAARLGLAGRASFQTGSWCEDLEERFNIIVSNPPYIADGERCALAPEVAMYDPEVALFAGADGLAAYRALIPGARTHLCKDGQLFLEIGAGQAPGVADLLIGAGFRAPETHLDLTGTIRCLGTTPA